MSCPVHASTITSTGTVFGGRAKVLTLAYIGTGTAGSVVLTDGGSGGTEVLDIATPGIAGAYTLSIPGHGILCSSDVYATLTNVTSLTVIYEG